MNDKLSSNGAYRFASLVRRRLATRRAGATVLALLAALTTGGFLLAAEPPPAQPPRPQRPPAVPPVQNPAVQRLGPPQAQVPQIRLAQFRFRVAQDGNDAPNASFVQPERERLRALSQARELLDQERYADAVKLLGAILGSSEDGVLPAEGDQPLRFLKAEALRLVGSMSADGRAAWQREYAAGAQKLLEKSIASGDHSGLERVAGQFFHTKAGYEATLRMAHHHLDHGRSMAAALCFERLRATTEASQLYEPALSFKTAACWMWAGAADKARDVLLELKHRHPDARLQVAGKPLSLFANDVQAVDWLLAAVGELPAADRLADDEAWLVFRGNAQRNAASNGSRPLLNYRWQVPVSNDPQILDLIESMRSAYLEQNLTALPALHPLVVHDGTRDVVLARTAVNLLAIDFATGKRIWEVPVEYSLELPLTGASSNERQSGSGIAENIDERLWEDAPYGTLSSDGVNVYAIEDLVIDQSAPAARRTVIRPNGQRRDISMWPIQYNRLAAYELKKEGKLLWTLGGPPGEEALPEAETFFLGPPLPVAGRLYVLAETKGQIRLLAIDPRKTENFGQALVEWSQPLADLEQGILELQRDNRLRRLAGATPSYSDGVLVCPTTAGAVAAVDVTTRSLLWGYQYRTDVGERVSRLDALQASTFPDGQGASIDRWVDATATLAEGKALLTPIDSSELHCLNLLGGERLWKAPREDGLFIGCVHQGKALVIGRNQVRALKLADGSPAWQVRVELPSGALPSGRGFASGGNYYLPLTTAEVVSIDLETGKLQRSISRRGAIAGNLVCYKGAVISQSADRIERFEQLDIQQQRVAEKLQQNPADPLALVEQAEILLDAGKLEEAVAALQKSFQLAPEPRTQELLFDSLLEGLRIDFVAHRRWTSEIERLAAGPRQQAAYLRALAEGLHQQGETLAAFDAYFRLTQLAASSDDLERVDPTLSVRHDRWVQARLPELRRTAKPQEQAQIDRQIQERFDAASASEDHDALRNFIRYFDEHPLAERARLLLADRLSDSEDGNALEIDLLLRRLEHSSSRELAAGGVARLARLLHDSGRLEQAAVRYERLAAEFADQVCLEGKTGRQLVDEVAADDGVRALFRQTSVWPEGVVNVKPLVSGASQAKHLVFDLSGSEDLADTKTLIEYHPQSALLVARDGFGQQLWSVALSEARQRISYGSIPAFHRARLYGNFVAVAMGNEVFAVDGLRGASAKVLWKQNLTETIPGLSSDAEIRDNPFMLGGRLFFGGNPYGMPITSLGPVTGRQICFQRVRNLVALDPLSGETLWTRHNIPPHSTLFGDEEVVVVLPAEQAENSERKVLLLRASDGQSLGWRTIPPGEPLSSLHPRLVTLGRKVLLLTHVDGKKRIQLFDPLSGQPAWQSKLVSLSAKVDVWRQQVVAVMEPAGRVQMFDLADGRQLADEQVEPVTDPQGPTPNLLNDIYLIGSRDHLVLLANPFTQGDAKLGAVQPIPFGNNNPVNPRIHGKAYGFARSTGKLLWKRTIERQGILLEQPSELPVLVLAANSYNQTAANRSSRVSLLCLDKRNGRTLFDKTLPYTLQTYELSADLEEKTVDLKTTRDSVRMRFTEEPLPEGDGADVDKPAGEAMKQSSLFGPVLKGLFKQAEGSFRVRIDPQALEGKLAPAPPPRPARDGAEQLPQRPKEDSK